MSSEGLKNSQFIQNCTDLLYHSNCFLETTKFISPKNRSPTVLWPTAITGDHEQNCPSSFLIPLMICCFIAVIGNLFTCFLILKVRRLKTATNVFVFSICITDIICAGILLPFHCFNGNSMVYNYLVLFIIWVYISNLTAVTWERLISITIPLRYHSIINKNKALKITVAAWIIPLPFSLIPLTYGSDQKSFVHKIYLSCTLLLFLLLPLFFISYVYGRILLEIHRLIKHHRRHMMPVYLCKPEKKSSKKSSRQTDTDVINVSLDEQEEKPASVPQPIQEISRPKNEKINHSSPALCGTDFGHTGSEYASTRTTIDAGRGRLTINNNEDDDIMHGKVIDEGSADIGSVYLAKNDNRVRNNGLPMRSHNTEVTEKLFKQDDLLASNLIMNEFDQTCNTVGRNTQLDQDVKNIEHKTDDTEGLANQRNGTSHVSRSGQGNQTILTDSNILFLDNNDFDDLDDFILSLQQQDQVSLIEKSCKKEEKKKNALSGKTTKGYYRSQMSPETKESLLVSVLEKSLASDDYPHNEDEADLIQEALISSSKNIEFQNHKKRNNMHEEPDEVFAPRLTEALMTTVSGNLTDKSRLKFHEDTRFTAHSTPDSSTRDSEVQSSSPRRRDIDNKRKSYAEKFKLAMTEMKSSFAFAAVAFTYMFTWLPVAYMTFMVIIGQPHKVPSSLAHVNIWTIAINGFIDPLIYALLLRDFRKTLKKLIKRYC